MTHRILLVLLSCTALGWAVPAMAEDDWGGSEATDQSYYDYGGAAAVGDGSADYWTGTGETTTDVGAVAGDQSYYDYGGAAATTSSGFDGVTNWTDESGATPTGNTITNWTEGDVDPLAAGGGGSFLDPAIGGIGAMSGFSMQNLSKLFNPTKPGGCNMSVPMMNNLSGNLAAFGKFLGAKESCDGARTLSGVKATVDAQGAVRTRALAEQQRYVSGAQINQANASGILAGGGGGASGGGGGLFGGAFDGLGAGGNLSLGAMATAAMNEAGLGGAMNTFNGAMGTVNNAMNMMNTDVNFLNSGPATGSSGLVVTNWTDADGGAVYPTAGVGSVATDNWSYDMGGTDAATTASSGFSFSAEAAKDGTPLPGAPASFSFSAEAAKDGTALPGAPTAFSFSAAGAD